MANWIPATSRRAALAFILTLLVGAPSATALPQSSHRAKKPTTSQHKKSKAAQPAKPAFSQQMLALQVALDRAGFSPGEIDGRPGTFTSRAVDAFRQARQLQGTGLDVDQPLADALGQ